MTDQCFSALSRTWLKTFALSLSRNAEVRAEAAAAHFAKLLFLQRMRTATDRQFVGRAFAQHWGRALPALQPPPILVSPQTIDIGWASLQRSHQGKNAPAIGRE